jgi:hypothetical protein
MTGYQQLTLALKPAVSNAENYPKYIQENFKPIYWLYTKLNKDGEFK